VKNNLLIILLLISSTSWGQDTAIQIFKIRANTHDSILPKFPGNFEWWMEQHLRYPDSAKINNISGTVYVTFIVEADGTVTSIKVVRGVLPLLDKEAVRVLSSMPHWIPGSINGKPQRQTFSEKVRFLLQ
jgi:periplasmic protein TonB